MSFLHEARAEKPRREWNSRANALDFRMPWISARILVFFGQRSFQNGRQNLVPLATAYTTQQTSTAKPAYSCQVKHSRACKFRCSAVKPTHSS